MGHGIHIFGASGSGTSTVGRRLAEKFGGACLDTDAYYWLPTDPPFTRKRAPAERVVLIRRDMERAENWVLSGSICSWGDPLLAHFSLAVFLYLDPKVRMSRLAAREAQRYGDRIAPGGDMHAGHLEFIEWARGYDEGKAPLRSRDLHEQWMGRLTCPVLRLNAEWPVDQLVDDIVNGAAGV